MLLLLAGDLQGWKLGELPPARAHQNYRFLPRYQPGKKFFGKQGPQYLVPTSTSSWAGGFLNTLTACNTLWLPRSQLSSSISSLSSLPNAPIVYQMQMSLPRWSWQPQRIIDRAYPQRWSSTHPTPPAPIVFIFSWKCIQIERSSRTFRKHIAPFEAFKYMPWQCYGEPQPAFEGQDVV